MQNLKKKFQTKVVDLIEINIFLNFAYWLRYTQKSMIFMVFSSFHYENGLIANFHYNIRNLGVKIHKYSEFQMYQRY